MLFHIVEPESWLEPHARESASDERVGYRPSSLESDGFIHLSTAAQLSTTLATHYPNAVKLVFVEVDEDLVASDLRWERAPGRSSPMPHLYRELRSGDIRAVHRLEKAGNVWSFPWLPR